MIPQAMASRGLAHASWHQCHVALSYMRLSLIPQRAWQSTLEPSGGSNVSMASPSNGINTFQVGERREAPPSGLLPQVCYQHAQVMVTSRGMCVPSFPCHELQGVLSFLL